MSAGFQVRRMLLLAYHIWRRASCKIRKGTWCCSAHRRRGNAAGGSCWFRSHLQLPQQGTVSGRKNRRRCCDRILPCPQPWYHSCGSLPDSDRTGRYTCQNRAWMNENHIAPYNEHTQNGYLRHIFVRTGFATGQVLLCLVTKNPKLPHTEQLIERAKTAVPSHWHEMQERSSVRRLFLRLSKMQKSMLSWTGSAMFDLSARMQVKLLQCWQMRETNRMLSWSTRREKALIKLQLMQSEKWHRIDSYTKRFSKVVQCLEDGLEDSPAFYAFPKLDARKILSSNSNMTEWLNRECGNTAHRSLTSFFESLFWELHLMQSCNKEVMKALSNPYR